MPFSSQISDALAIKRKYASICLAMSQASSREPFRTVRTLYRAVDRCAVTVLCFVNCDNMIFVTTNRQPNNLKFYYFVLKFRSRS